MRKTGAGGWVLGAGKNFFQHRNVLAIFLLIYRDSMDKKAGLGLGRCKDKVLLLFERPDRPGYESYAVGDGGYL